MAESRDSGMKRFRHLALEKYKWITYAISAIVICSLTIVVFNAEAKDKSDIMNRGSDIDVILSGLDTRAKVDPKVLEKYVDTTEEKSFTGDLDEGKARNEVILSTVSEVVVSISARLTWADETDPPGLRIRRYVNGPDTFTVSILNTNGTKVASGTGSSGDLTVDRGFDQEEVISMFGKGNLTVKVDLDEAGDWTPRLGPGIPIADDGNSYSLEITIGYRVDPKMLEED